MRIVVAAAMIDGLGRVLLQRRPEGKQHGGLWEFPGGKVEAGEGPVQALIREIDEELGVALSAADITPLSFAHADDSSGTPPICCCYTSAVCGKGNRSVKKCDAEMGGKTGNIDVSDAAPGCSAGKSGACVAEVTCQPGIALLKARLRRP
jgi:ADP-ribose pyrophosphatase YjhB (NUDIX family)